jgi:glucokinase
MSRAGRSGKCPPLTARNPRTYTASKMLRPSQSISDARNNRHLRHLNLERLLAVAMERTEPFTRADLTAATALSIPTIGTLTGHLIRRGLLCHLGTRPSKGGRRPSFMEFNSRYGFVAGFVMRPTDTVVALADLRGNRLATRTWPLPVGLAPDAVIAKIASWVRSLMADAGAATGRLLALTAAFPGAVDHIRGITSLSNNLKGWEQVPMAKRLREELGEMPVVVENDTNLAILGERWHGAARGHNNCVFVYAGSSIGSGVVVNGELHHGHHFLAGEIGLMPMGPEPADGSRVSASLEAVAGLKAMASRWSGRGDFLDAAKKGEAKAKKLIEESARLVGTALTNFSLAVDPSLVVLGGPLGEVPDFAQRVRERVARFIPTPPEIVAPALGDESTLWGSLLVATGEAQRDLRQHLRHEAPGEATARP